MFKIFHSLFVCWRKWKEKSDMTFNQGLKREARIP